MKNDKFDLSAKYLIIGNSIASVATIEGIRSNDKNGSIIIVSKEKHLAYSRPLISYFLQGKIDIKNINYRSDDFYDKNKCKIIYDEAIQIDESNKLVNTKKGLTISFKKLHI